MSAKTLLLKLWTLGLLFFINLMNTMDRQTVSGILPLLQNASRNGFNESLSDLEGGLIQTTSIMSFVLFGPIFGYLGDRLTRKYIVAAGLFIWSGLILASSFSVNIPMLIAVRSLVGIGEATYATIAPTVIADLFPAKSRIRALAVYGLAVPIGSAMGIGVGSLVASEAYKYLKDVDSWRWAFRILPGFGILTAILVIFTVPEPPRGQCEDPRNKTGVKGKTGWKELFMDILYLLTNKTYMLTSLGFSTLGFALGALGQWTPSYIYRSSRLLNADDLSKAYSSSEASEICGIVVVIAALIGIMSGSELSKLLNKKTDKADTIVCAASLLVGGPVLYNALVFGLINMPLGWFLVFVTQYFLTFMSAPIGAILLYVVVPERRAIAVAIQIVMIHVLGDAISPSIVGAMSDSIQNKLRINYDKIYSDCIGLQYALFTNAFMLVIGGGLYLYSTTTVLSDRQAVKDHVNRTNTRHRSTSVQAERNQSLNSNIPSTYKPVSLTDEEPSDDEDTSDEKSPLLTGSNKVAT